MSAEPIAIKVEPSDDYPPDAISVSPHYVMNGDSDYTSDLVSPGGSSVTASDARNFTCLLCEVICESREDLRRHLKTCHASKHAAFSSYVTGQLSPEAAIAGLSTYMNYRYTCSICGAKFKTLRTYLSHNMSHRRVAGPQIEEASMASILNTGKQYLQEYMDSDDGYPGTFTCPECNTVFTQRDSYAMHMMMRAMNETCKHPSPISPVKPEREDPDDNISDKNTNGTVSASSSDTETKPVLQQKCLEDVTSNVDQDEYLKSVLDKVFIGEQTKHDSSQRIANEDRKMCKFCGGSFLDQDALAMHVMSDHSAEMCLPAKRPGGRPIKYTKYSQWINHSQAAMLNYACMYCGESFVSRDSLAMHVFTHARQGIKRSNILQQNNNSLKRAREIELEHIVITNQRSKILRSMAQHHLQLSQKENEEQQSRSASSEDDLHCEKCNIKFYLRSEYDWHTRNYHETRDSNDIQPLCLTKHSSNKGTENEDPEDVSRRPNSVNIEQIQPEPYTKQRRNSFSYDKASRNYDQAPKRPFSADDCSNFMLNASKQDQSADPDSSMITAKSKLHSSSFVPNLNALSSNEQRIIFSVFGKNLNYNKFCEEKSKHDREVESSESSNDQNCHELEPHQTVPADLSIAKDSDKLTTDDNSSEDQSTSDKMAAVAERENHSRVLNTDSDAPMCKYCDIVFFNKAIYYLHMGLHNVNNPWQCNICGKICSDAVDFAAHVIHM